jgi:phage baseplate assembly protein gpV
VTDFEELLAEVVALRAELSETRTAMRNMVRTGTVEKRDADKGYRLNWGKDDKGATIMSPWYPHPESGGAAKTWLPLSEGQIVTAINPGGDFRQGFLVRGGFSDQNPKPGFELTQNGFTFGNVRVEIADGSLKLSIGGSTIEITAAAMSFKAAAIKWIKG